jgi:zinc and cadmium transporter
MAASVLSHRTLTAWIMSLGSVVAVSLVSLAGLATLSMDERRLRRWALVFVSFAVGALLGDAFIHLIPEAFESGGSLETSLSILAGILLFFAIEKLLRHHHGPLYSEHHPADSRHPVIAAVNVAGDAIHNFVDGVLIAASYLASPTLGMTTTIAVILHEIPQEIGDFGVLVHSGLTVRRAVALNLASASASILGAIATLLAGAAAGATIVSVLVPVTAGGFVYIAASNLIPELQHDRGLRGLAVQAGLIALGIAVMAALTGL